MAENSRKGRAALRTFTIYSTDQIQPLMNAPVCTSSILHRLPKSKESNSQLQTNHRSLQEFLFTIWKHRPVIQRKVLGLEDLTEDHSETRSTISLV